MEKEIWKTLECLNYNYEVSNFGRIRGIDRVTNTSDGKDCFRKGVIMKVHNRKNHYSSIAISINGKHKTFQLHRLVALAFLPNPNNYPCVNHKDENKHNNNVDNLEWCTYRYNSYYSSYKNWKSVRQIDKDGNVKNWDSAIHAAKELGFKKQSITCSAVGLNKLYKGFAWCYEDESDEDIKKRFVNMSKGTNSHTAVRLDLFSREGEYIKTYDMLQDACEDLNVSSTAIYHVIHGKNKTVKGYIIKYKDK